MKKCSKCLIEKPLSEFYAPKGRKSADGSPYYLPQCKACYAAYYAANRQRQTESNRRNQIKKLYGITLEEYRRRMKAGCEVCGKQGSSSRNGLHMDHCHTSGKVRGVLCSACNHALGNANDDPKRLRALADYLERHSVA